MLSLLRMLDEPGCRVFNLPKVELVFVAIVIDGHEFDFGLVLYSVID